MRGRQLVLIMGRASRRLQLPERSTFKILGKVIQYRMLPMSQGVNPWSGNLGNPGRVGQQQHFFEGNKNAACILAFSNKPKMHPAFY